MAKPVSVFINKTSSTYFNYEDQPVWFDFKFFETMTTMFTLGQLEATNQSCLDITVVFDNQEALQCILPLGQDKNWCFSDMVGDLLYLFDNEEGYEEAKKLLGPVLEEIEFTIH